MKLTDIVKLNEAEIDPAFLQKVRAALSKVSSARRVSEAATAQDAESLTNAIKDFQTKAGITADGKVGPQTKKAHQDAMAAGNAPAASGAGDAAAAQNAAAPAAGAAPDQSGAETARLAAAGQQAAAPAAPAQQAAAPAAPAQQAAAPAQQAAAPAAPAQQAAAPAQQAAGGGSGTGGAYTAADINNGNMPSGLPRETVTNIQAAARSARNPNAVVYDPNDNADF